ncbi:curlin repeat-containing protein [Mesorhizobium sp. VK25A]|uniref:Curlin repeat-containing protein n=1 Tax=Mesorhizobium vachelliae TaxID=3072309 RepID=A0ABU5A234_9HYPH|nr:MULTISPECIES: curlin repeat-containing protein [unclassified Mesorhizobium]MDX8531725.1 curlin repeat-containing protein [Mesorhizobium sp. VK25D]MDX8543832.1 curlin repeat-containing protein [Mesorhizobium sp. VK25A]
MNRQIAKLIGATALAVAVGFPLFSGPAQAGGSIGFYFSPRTAQDAEALDLGLRAYSFYNGLRSGASVRQFGRNNYAGIGQSGGGNLGIIHQEGSGHSATLRQRGNDNSYGIFEFGRNTDTSVVQAGDGQSGAALLFGW